MQTRIIGEVAFVTVTAAIMLLVLLVTTTMTMAQPVNAQFTLPGTNITSRQQQLQEQQQLTLQQEQPGESELERALRLNASGEIGPMNETVLQTFAEARQAIIDEQAENSALRTEVLEVNVTQASNFMNLWSDFADSCLDVIDQVPWDMNGTKKCGKVFGDFNQQMEGLLSKHKGTFDEILYGISNSSSE